MAEILYELDVKAIFFVNGQLLDTPENQEILQKMYAMGHTIGNHTMNHPDLSTISDDEQRKQIVGLNDLIEEIIGERPRFFRAPFGKNTDTSREIMVEEGMQWMNWSYGYDWVAEYMEAEALAKIMVEPDPPGLLRNGANLLIHDREFTRDALKAIVEGIREKGFEFVDPALIK
ncbi:MAG: polysaccharide deacetylase family protein [Bacillus sp. (in: Bacteria)]|nr:polysaccharide deacetylase family protein [Bacillus sp. (in: firmicutes)]